VQEIGGKAYGFNAQGHKASGWLAINGQTRYFDPAQGGAAPQGWFQHSNGHTYYFWWGSGGIFATGTQSIGGKAYGFNAQGHKVVGWQAIDGAARYFDPAQDGAAPQGWFSHSNGHTYYFWWSGKGTFATGAQRIDGRAYGFNAQGHKVTGWQTIDGKVRYFDPAQDGAAPEGWYDQNGSRYYFWPSDLGAFATGLQSIGGNEYYFNDQGHMLKSQVVTVGAWEYTLGADGAVTSKKQLITADIAIETDIVLTGSGTGWHGKVVFMDATHAISFGILHDPAFNPNAGDWLMFESASASGNLQEYTFLEQVASGKHRIRLEWYKDSRLAKGYCDGRYIGEVYTAAISVLNPTIDFIGTARASGDTVDAVFSNFNIDVKGRVPYASHTWKYGSTAATNGPMVFYGDFHSDLINNGGAEYEKGHTYSTVNEWHLWGRAQFPYGDWGTPAFATVGAHAQQIWN
jgi:glucan-binding YG repeat protein